MRAVRDMTKLREFKKREFREFWVKGSQILFWQIKRVLFVKAFVVDVSTKLFFVSAWFTF